MKKAGKDWKPPQWRRIRLAIGEAQADVISGVAYTRSTLRILGFDY